MDIATSIPDYRNGGRPVILTEVAARKAHELISEEGDPSLKLRVYIHGGGCSGFQYGFTFDEEQDADDLAVERDGVTLLCDPISLQYLAGAEVSYTENLSGARFVVSNPNTKTTCGCNSADDD